MASRGPASRGRDSAFIGDIASAEKACYTTEYPRRIAGSFRQASWCDRARGAPAAFEKTHRLRQRVIAAINGYALGGGFALALACDIRFAVPQATFGAVFIRHGVAASDMGASYHLPRLICASRAVELMLTGRVIDAREAATIGLVLGVVDRGELLDAAVANARKIARNSPLAVWMTTAAVSHRSRTLRTRSAVI